MPDNAIPLIQASFIMAAFRDAAMYPLGSTPGGHPPTEFFFHVGFLLTTEKDQEAVLDAVPKRTFSSRDVTLAGAVLESNPIPGLARIELLFKTPKEANRDRPRAEEDEPDPPIEPPDPYIEPKAQITIDVLKALEKRLGPGVAELEYLLTLTQIVRPNMVTWCPYGEPTPVPQQTAPLPGVSTSHCDGEGTQVVVVDTGLVLDAPATHPWMNGVTGDPDLDSPVGGLIGLYGGHGTFIASIIRAMAPKATVHVARVLEKAGAAWETDIVTALYAVTNSNPVPDVISLSAGTYTQDNRPPLSFTVFLQWLQQNHPGTVLVAAAGNNGSSQPFFPAAMPPVVGVGALDVAGNTLATWSNEGPWVSVYAPGENLVHAFGSGKYTYTETPRSGQTATFDHMAEWSGTSFSTPVVAGLIAARMPGHRETAPEAKNDLLALAQTQELPGTQAEPGPWPVLYPGQAC